MTISRAEIWNSSRSNGFFKITADQVMFALYRGGLMWYIFFLLMDGKFGFAKKVK